MQYGFVIPRGQAKEFVEMGVLAEEHGWDAVFGWEVVYGLDGWVILGAIAARTSKVRLGTLVTSPSRRRPWKLASEVATLDQLSGGRAVLIVGLGDLETGFAAVGEETDRKIRAELMDESIELMHHFWTGGKFTYSGKHYQVDWSDPFMDLTPMQPGGVPIWPIAVWPSERSMARAFRNDGALPTKRSGSNEWTSLEPEEVVELRKLADEKHEGSRHFDIVIEGTSKPGNSDDLARIRSFDEAGADWWIESPWHLTEDIPAVRERILAGPPKP